MLNKILNLFQKKKSDFYGVKNETEILCDLNLSTRTRIYAYQDLIQIVNGLLDSNLFNFNYFKAGNIDKRGLKYYPINVLNWNKLSIKDIFRVGFSLASNIQAEQVFNFHLGDRFNNDGYYVNPFPYQGVGGKIIINKLNEINVINYIKNHIISYDSSFCCLIGTDILEIINNIRIKKGKGFYLEISEGTFFLTYIRPVFVPILGKEKLLKAPAYRVEELENGGILIQSTESIFDYHNGTQEEINKKLQELEALDDYILSLYPDNDIRLNILHNEAKNIKEQNLTLDYLMNN